jgi:hypothetical protein
LGVSAVAAPESTLHYLLGFKTRARIVERLIVHDYEQGPLWIRELFRCSGAGFSGLYRERMRLEQLGLMRSYRQGPNLCVAVIEDHPLYESLRGIVDAAREMARSYANSASRHLEPLPDDPAVEILRLTVEFVLERQK